MNVAEQWTMLLRRDPVKAWIAGHIQRTLRAPYIPVIPLVEGLTSEDVVSQALSPTETMIRVRTSESIRYFHVKVTEKR